MPYGIINKLLLEKCVQDMVLIESPFLETTRSGSSLDSVRLALTPNMLVIASNDMLEHKSFKKKTSENAIDINSVHPLKTVKVTVFKRTHRQTLKVCFQDNYIRYFDLGKLHKRKIFWELWCTFVAEVNSDKKQWPFSSSYTQPNHLWTSIDCVVSINNSTPEQKAASWTDKYLYLGSRREIADKSRPYPVPGLGRTEDIKLLYLKPQYFGCWEQSEHWVQCAVSSALSSKENTYSVASTSYDTYNTSLMTSWK